jgi:hypothetical protein
MIPTRSAFGRQGVFFTAYYAHTLWSGVKDDTHLYIYPDSSNAN